MATKTSSKKSNPKDIVYVLSNLAMHGYCNVGITNDIVTMMGKLYTKGVPLVVQCDRAWQVKDEGSAIKIEKKIQTDFANVRDSKNRGFFEIESKKLIATLNITGTNATPAANAGVKAKDAIALASKRKRVTAKGADRNKPNFKFSMIRSQKRCRT